MKNLILAILFALPPTMLTGQYHPDRNRDALWYLGYGGLPQDTTHGGTDIDFSCQPPCITFHYREMYFNRSNASVCDTSGNLLFYTNGFLVFDSSDQTMLEGDTINPGYIQHNNGGWGGYPVSQTTLILPAPGSDSLYYLLHLGCAINANGTVLYGEKVYYTLVDMSGNNHLGEVLESNHLVMQFYFSWGKMTACRHGNGRDWWVLVPGLDNNYFYKFLLDPAGFRYIGHQVVGASFEDGLGQAVFSPAGNKYVVESSYHIYLGSNVNIYDFDRCNGDLSNPVQFTFSDTAYASGCAISPNSRYLYVSSYLHMYQYDLQSNNIDSSRVTIGVYDGYVDPDFAGGYTHFYLPQLAPDGKIYITSTNSVRSLHVINNPDSMGLACGFVQHGVPLPTFHTFSLPNYPNFRLGALVGSPCDTLDAAVSVPYPVPINESIGVAVNAYPNPASNSCTIGIGRALPQEGRMEVHDMGGRLVEAHMLRAATIGYGLNTASWPTGSYVVTVWCGGAIWGATQIVIEH